MVQVAKVSSNERLYGLARSAAVDAAGGVRAFRVIGSTFAIALIKAEVLGLLYRQDEAVTDVRVREILAYCYERASDEIETWDRIG